LLLVTRSNSGFDADTVPTMVELSLFGRSDVVHGPSFEDAKTPPVVTGFEREKGLWPPSGAIFAAGPAAMAIASRNQEANRCPDEEVLRRLEKQYDDLTEIKLTRAPQFDNRSKRLFAAGEVPPMWFATAESLGFELEFFGPSFPPLLQSVHAGYRRKEFLATPLSISAEETRDGPYVVRTPSVLALVNVLDSNDGQPPGTKNELGHNRAPRKMQLFATGSAATRLAADPRVQDIFLRPLIGKQDSHCPAPAKSAAEAPSEK